MHHNFINAYYSTKVQYQQNKRIFKAYPRGQKYMNTVRINEGSFPPPPSPPPVGTEAGCSVCISRHAVYGFVTSSQLPSYVYVHLKRIRGNVVRNYMPSAYIQRTKRGTGALINARISYADSPF